MRARRPSRGLAAALVLSAVLAASRDAAAYVRYRTKSGLLWSWRGSNCLSIVAYPRDFSDMTAAEVMNAATAAAAAWSEGENACTFLHLSISVSGDAGPLVIPAAQAAIVFREAAWCRVLDDGSCSKKAEDVGTYVEEALMLTTATVNPRTGAMVEAGIEVNGHDHAWADLVAHPDKAFENDLQNAFTHELGHFIGLDHNCTPAGAPTPSLDGDGKPAPSCDGAPAAITEATMFPDAAPGDISKRTLAADDRAGLCAAYPVANDPGACGPTDPGDLGNGCSCATAPNGQGLRRALATFLVVASVRRRRRGRYC